MFYFLYITNCQNMTYVFLVAQDENHSNIWKYHSFTVFEDTVYIQALHGSHAQSQPEC